MSVVLQEQRKIATAISGFSDLIGFAYCTVFRNFRKSAAENLYMVKY